MELPDGFIINSKVPTVNSCVYVQSQAVCAPQIVSRYDIVLILEVVDISGESVETFFDALNRFVSAETSPFRLVKRLC